MLSCESDLATRVSFLVTGSPGFGLDGSVLERELDSPLSSESKTSEMKLGVASLFWLRGCNCADSNAQQMSAVRELLILEG